MINWNKLPEDVVLGAHKIARRARELDLCVDTIEAEMDICAVGSQMKLDYNAWYKADDFNFAHDFCGIQKNINRETGKLENCFLPRFAR